MKEPKLGFPTKKNLDNYEEIMVDADAIPKPKKQIVLMNPKPRNIKI